MSDHKFITECKDKCGHCFICNCGYCGECGLYEGALTTQCPGKQVSSARSEEVYKGLINFRGGIWLKECSEQSPEFLHLHAKEWSEQNPKE